MSESETQGLAFSSRYDEWKKGMDGSFTSPAWRADQVEQIMVYAAQTKDGWIEADITPAAGGRNAGGEDQKEAGFLVRYQPPERGYCAGLGAFGTKYFIARMNPNSWQVLASIGRSSSIEYKKTYRLKLEFVGSEILLYENGVLLLSVVDESY